MAFCQRGREQGEIHSLYYTLAVHRRARHRPPSIKAGGETGGTSKEQENSKVSVLGIMPVSHYRESPGDPPSLCSNSRGIHRGSTRDLF